MNKNTTNLLRRREGDRGKPSDIYAHPEISEKENEGQSLEIKKSLECYCNCSNFLTDSVVF